MYIDKCTEDQLKIWLNDIKMNRDEFYKKYVQGSNKNLQTIQCDKQNSQTACIKKDISNFHIFVDEGPSTEDLRRIAKSLNKQLPKDSQTIWIVKNGTLIQISREEYLGIYNINNSLLGMREGLHYGYYKRYVY